MRSIVVALALAALAPAAFAAGPAASAPSSSCLNCDGGAAQASPDADVPRLEDEISLPKVPASAPKPAVLPLGSADPAIEDMTTLEVIEK